MKRYQPSKKTQDIALKAVRLNEIMELFDGEPLQVRHNPSPDISVQPMAAANRCQVVRSMTGSETPAPLLVQATTTPASIETVESEYALAVSGRPDWQALMRTFKEGIQPDVVQPAEPYERTRLQAEMADWLGQVEWNLMVTFTFSAEDGVSLPLASKLFGKFIPRLREIVLRKGSRSKIKMAAFVEDSREQLQNVGLQVDGREGTHIHVLLHVRGDDLYKYKDAIEKAWKATNRLCGDPTIYCPDSDEWYLPLTSGEMRRGYTGYVLKHHGTDTLGLLIQFLNFD
jgi:hypothetical protein